MEKNSKDFRNEIIFWFNTPPKVSKGAFNYVSKAWGKKVIYVINKDFPEYRKKTNWNDGDFGNAEVIMLSKCKDEKEKIDEIFKLYPNSIHVISAFTNSIQFKIRKHILRNNIKLSAFSERPVTIGNFFEKNIRRIYFQYKYRRIEHIFGKYVSAFLPFGTKGVDSFHAYGWKLEKMYPFMYNPIIHKNKKLTSRVLKKNDKIRFLYVGRFYYKTKGIDTLIDAVNLLNGDWQLDLVGGYGKNKDFVIEWARKNPRVNYLGSWQSHEVCDNMTNYDIIVVPSRYDGWNLLPNEAIHAGIGTIVTDEAVSDEIITASCTGKVVPSSNPKLMAAEMQLLINNFDEINKLKQNTVDYVEKISPKVVGNYFMQIMDFAFYQEGKRPKCPWL